MDNLDRLMPQLTALMPEMIANMKDMKTTMLTMYSTQKGLQDQQKESQKNSSAMGKAFDESKNDDSFYLPPETFKNAEFKRGMKNFISPDGHAVRFIISHQGDPMTQEGISHIDAIKHAAQEALKGTPLEGSKIYLGGTRRRLQLAAGVAVQGGDPRRPEYRDHPVDGWHRIGGHVGRAGVRVHDDDDGGQ
jgi:RND superfamily putative drug exporter